MSFELYPPTVPSVVLLAVGFLLYQIFVWRRDGLSNIPFHKFDEDDTPQRYIQDSKTLLHAGYLKVSFATDDSKAQCLDG